MEQAQDLSLSSLRVWCFTLTALCFPLLLPLLHAMMTGRLYCEWTRRRGSHNAVVACCWCRILSCHRFVFQFIVFVLLESQAVTSRLPLLLLRSVPYHTVDFMAVSAVSCGNLHYYGAWCLCCCSLPVPVVHDEWKEAPWSTSTSFWFIGNRRAEASQ